MESGFRARVPGKDFVNDQGFRATATQFSILGCERQGASRRLKLEKPAASALPLIY